MRLVRIDFCYRFATMQGMRSIFDRKNGLSLAHVRYNFSLKNLRALSDLATKNRQIVIFEVKNLKNNRNKINNFEFWRTSTTVMAVWLQALIWTVTWYTSMSLGHPRCLSFPWWRHQMETFSTSLAICAGNSPASGEFPAQRPVSRSFHVFFDLCLNTRLRKQQWGWWFETLSRPLWRHCNVGMISIIISVKMFRIRNYEVTGSQRAKKACCRFVLICSAFWYCLFRY